MSSTRSSRRAPTYDCIGAGYDRTRRADPHLVARLSGLLRQRARGRYLDLACGTGNYTAALASRGGVWLGVDLSARMLREAVRKAAAVRWCRADAARLPLRDAGVDGVVVTLALHHFASLAATFSQAARVLAPGAPLVAFTSTAEQMRGYWLNHYFPAPLRRSIDQMPSFPALRAALEAAGLGVVASEPYHVREDLEDLFLYSGKHRPEIYLDERVRAGSSTFSMLAAPEEVAAGCRRLARDLADGRFAEVAAAYDDCDGDYLFLVAGHREER